jgi:hypothetical protein
MTLRNTIYYNDNANQIPLAGIANLNLPYTDVIIGFLIPGSDGTTLVGGGGPNGGAFDDQLQNCGCSTSIDDGGMSTATGVGCRASRPTGIAAVSSIASIVA